MVRKILIALFIFIVLALLVIWIISGGPRQLITGTQESLSSALTPDESEGFRLPWQPAALFPEINIVDVLDLSLDDDGGFPGEQTTEEQLRELEDEYDRLRGEASRRSVNPPSPYAGRIGFAQDSLSGVRASNPHEESIQIVASYSNAEGINISGWTLQSALSSVNIQIPLAAAPLISGGANTVGAVTLEPGGTALVSSGSSPVGLSFRENMCIGYLQQFQRFEPPLQEECPSPSSVLPLTEQNLQRYGDACFDATKNLSHCRFPQNIPATAWPSCRTFLTDAFSYNGCVRDNRFRSEFHKDTWRLYLGSGGELWRNSHDAIRLLDAEGRTVSVFVY